jgi:hypothetical protein
MPNHKYVEKDPYYKDSTSERVKKK